MSLIRKWFEKALSFLGYKSSTSFRKIEVEYFPEQLEKGKVYVEGDWSASFICPCGCSELIELNLIDDVRPVWEIKGGSLPTIKPSVWKKEGCKSHFFVTNGKVVWCQA